mmetsp:Transcript_22209/g.37705  ORF Transcript_22209/g.37705 Transcript_22209/m.37705 type:complete len:92 (-) Transcript_22209:234-509(-)
MDLGDNEHGTTLPVFNIFFPGNTNRLHRFPPPECNRQKHAISPFCFGGLPPLWGIIHCCNNHPTIHHVTQHETATEGWATAYSMMAHKGPR